jgi:SAM-dependent methyltransferase
MPRSSPFQNHLERYERWFSKYRWAYEAELKAVRSLLPREGRGVEVGVGTGRFAAPLGVPFGVEPVFKMAERARDLKINVTGGVAEELPFRNSLFDYLLMVTTVCFVDDLYKALTEADRVLTRKGRLIVAFVDRESPLGRMYGKNKDESVFYKTATFYSVPELTGVMRQSGFKNFTFRQTLFHELSKVTDAEPVKRGHGEGAFVVISGAKG